MKTIVHSNVKRSLTKSGNTLRNYHRGKQAQPLRVVESACKAVAKLSQQIRRLLSQQASSVAARPVPTAKLAFPLRPYQTCQRRVDVALPVRFMLGAYLSVIAILCMQVIALPGNASPTARKSGKTKIARSTTVARRKPVVLASRRGRRAASWDSKLQSRPPKGHFVRSFRMKATAYTPINTRMEGGRYTKTERDGRAVHGVAVDPDLIPLGSKLWIPGYGHAIADDTGGRIQGHRIDVRVQERDQMHEWGYRPVRVYVLQEPAT